MALFKMPEGTTRLSLDPQNSFEANADGTFEAHESLAERILGLGLGFSRAVPGGAFPPPQEPLPELGKSLAQIAEEQMKEKKERPLSLAEAEEIVKKAKA